MDLQQVLSSLERADAAGDTQAAQELANLARSLMAGQAPQTPPAIIPQTGFIPSVKRGALGIQSLFGDVLPAMAGKVVGAEDYAKKQLEEAAQAQKDIQARYPSEVPSYTDIKDVGTALTYIKESIGEAIPSMIPSLITGGAASLLAKPAQAAAIKAAETFAAEEIAKAAAKNVISKEALDQIKQAAIQKGTQEAQKIGLQATAAGALTGSAAQNIPDVYQNIYEKTGQTDLGAALVAGGFNAALDAITPFRILSKFNKTGLTPQELIGAWYKRAGKGAAEGLITEGATETLQEASSAAAENFVAQNPDFFTKENFERFVNAGLKGAVGGAAITGATNVVAGRAEPEAKPEVKPEVKPDVTSKVTPEVQPEISPEQTRARVEEVTGVNKEAAPSAQESAETFARTSRMEDEEGRAYAEKVARERLLRQQQEMDAEAERIAELNKKQGIQTPVPPPKTVEEKPSIYEEPPALAKREDLLAKQAEVDKRRLEAGLPTGESSVTPGVQPKAPEFVEPKPTPKIVDNRPLQERAAKNRLLVMRNMLQNQGGDPNSLTIVPHPQIKDRFVIQSLDVPTKFTKNLPATAIDRPESPAIIDPVNAYVEIQRRTNTPAARRFVQDFEAGKITREDVETAIEQERKAGRPQPLTYTPTGEPGIIAAETSKPRGEREVPTFERTPVTEVAPETPTETPAETPTAVTQPKTLEEFRQRMPIVSDRPEVRSSNNEGNFTKLTQALQLSSNPAIRRIGELGAGISSKIRLRKPGRIGVGVLGVYRYGDDSIQMAPSHAGDEHTNAHETLHALISKAQRFPTDRQKPVVAKIEELYLYVKKELSKKGITAYGLTNPREFTAEAMTNPEFQFELMKIPYPGKKSAWSQFTQLVADLLGIKNTNALTEVMNLVDKLATQKQPRKSVTDKTLVDMMADQKAVEEPRLETFPDEQMASLRDKAAEQLTAFEQSLRTLLNKFGLKEIGLKLSEGMRDEGSYAAKLIQIAADSANPIRTLRHEAIHALRELGFFTDAQWNSLSKMAKDKWIDQYLKQRNIDGKPLKAGEESRYDAYMREYKGDMEKITEEAVADAFADFDATKAPAGMLQAILQKLRNLFQSIKTALTKVEAPEKIFGKVEKGELKPEAQRTSEGKKSLREKKIVFYEDIPNESWLKGKRDYAISSPRNEFGVPKMSSVTGSFNDRVLFPARWASELQGERGEQKNVRQKDLEAIRKIIKETGKFPLMDGKEYFPYIEIGYDGKPWISEGNHRIMAAVAEGMDYIPVELRYFDGGQRFAGKWSPDNLLEITNKVRQEAKPEAQRVATESKSLRDKATANFKRWFGDSKVVDENGEPLVMYHGSTKVGEDGQPFTKFSRTKQYGYHVGTAEQATNINVLNRGWGASERTKSGAYMMPLYIRAENPLRVTDNEANDAIDLMRRLKNDGAITPEEYEKYRKEGNQTQNWESALIATLERLGYDSLVYENTVEGKGDSYVLLNPNQIKSAIGNNGEYSLTDADIRKSLRSTAEKTKEKAQQLLQKRAPINVEALSDVDPEYVARLGRVFNPQSKTIIDKIEGMKDGFWRRAAQGLADQYRTIKDYDMRSYMLARMSKTQDGALEGLMFSGHVFNDGGALNIKKNTKGLMEALKPVGNETDRYMMWIALSRESNLEEGKKSPQLTELALERDKLIQGTLNGKPRLEVYKSVQKDMNALNKSVLDVALDMGLINSSKREIAELESRTDISEKKKAERIAYLQEHPGAYERFTSDLFYIPFYKQMEDGDIESAVSSAGLTSQKFSAELKGMSDKPFGDLMENTLRNWSHILSASMKNQAANSTINATMKAGATIPNMKAGLAYEDGKVVSKKTGELVGDGKLRPEYTESGKGIVKIMQDGQPMYFEVLDPMLLDSITSIGYMGPKSKFLDVARDFKNMLQFGVTVSPIFKTNNLIRDSISSMAVSDLKKNPFANVIEGWGLAGQNNPAHIEALAGGAIFNFGSTYEGDQAKLVKRLLKQGVKEEHILDTKDKIEAGLKGLWDKYQELGNKSEAANRLALYKQLRDKGMSHLEASFQARDLMDFSMQGSWPAFRTVTMVVPFLNARVQGLYKLGRDGIVPTSRVLYNTITGKPIDYTDQQKAYSFGLVTTSVSLASMALYLAFKDDEEFKKRDEWDRDNFWWIKLPNMDYALRVPKPFEIGAFGTMVERVLEQILDEGAEGKQFGESLSRMLFDTFAMNPFPQMFKPLLDLYANKDSFTGAPIESAGMERLSKQERMTEQTSPLAKALGGMSQILGEKGELSPAQVDYAIKGYFGWLGSMAATTSMYATMPFKEGAYPDTNWMDKASLGLVRTLPAAQSKYSTAFYEANKEISQAFADMRHYAEIGDSERVQEILEEKQDKIALNKLYDKTAKNMAKVRLQIRVVMNDTTMDGASKKEEVERLKQLISMMAEQAEEVRKSMK